MEGEREREREKREREEDRELKKKVCVRWSDKSSLSSHSPHLLR